MSAWLQRLLTITVSAFLAVAPAMAQESRGGISGRVSDPGGAVIPSAKVSITNTLTNEVRRTATNDTGYYEVNFLEPATYTITVEADGFKKLVRGNVDVSVSTKLDIPIQLQLGAVAETIEVKAETPLLETTSASGGRVLDQRNLINLPFSDLNPFALTALAPGMQWTGQPEYRRPFDNGGTSAFNTMGGVGQNEYTIDGITVTGTGRRVGYVPPADSITEFKLETSNFDASQGFTSGAAINVVSRSGTNDLHGSLFNQHWQQRWNATGHFQRLNWENQVRQGRISPDTPKQATGRSNNYGLNASGPVWIPKLFNGRNKLFWTFTWNGIRQSKAESTDAVNRTVPTAAMRQGDFSQLLTLPNGANLFTIYDPRSARREGNNVVRTPFPGNRGVPILNPMYEKYVRLFPTANNVPGLVTPEGFNNYLAFAMPKDEKFNSLINRYDYVHSDKHRFNGRWQWNDRLADEYDWTYETERGLHTNGLTRINKGLNFGWLYMMNSTNILDTSFGISRFEEGSRAFALTKYKPSEVGLPAYMDARAGDLHMLPALDFNNIQDVSGGYPFIGQKASTYSLRAMMTTIKGNHSFKYGYEGRRMDFAAGGPGITSGAFSFRNNYTRRADNDNVSSNHGHDWAAFMMGLPNGASIDTNDSFYWRTPRHALFFQDDFRVNAKLRLSLGVRYEREAGISERYNRGIAAPFFSDIKLPFTDQVQAAYAANPIPELPASQFRVLGGTRYLGMDGFDTATKGTNQFLPKVGAVYSLDSKTVIRAGWGMYMDTLNVNNTRPNTTGFSLPTGTPITTDAGLTICCGVGAVGNLANGRTVIADPFPVRANGTRFDEPLKNALGNIPQVGRGFGSLPYDYRPALQQRWRIGFQREVARNTLVDLSYNGAYSSVPVNYRIDALPQQYWTTGNARNQANDDFLNTNVTNPYNIRNLASLQASNPVIYNYLAGQGLFTSTVIRRNQLLRPFGHMSGVNGVRPDQSTADSRGYVRYHDFQALVERRYMKGLTASFMYTKASSYAADFLLNEFDSKPSERINDNVRPHRVAATWIYETPFGKGRTFVKNGLASHLIGNWNLSGVFQWQMGEATDWGNRFFYGDINQLKSLFNHSGVNKNDIHQWFDGSIAWRGSGAPPAGFVGFEGRSAAQPGSYHVRTFPVRLDSIREDGIMNWDWKIERTFPIKPERGIQARFSVDLLNALNRTNFGGPNVDPTSPNFGKVTSQRGLPRVIQFNLRFEF